MGIAPSSFMSILGSLFDSLVSDFVLAFTFFTALTYTVLSKRFDHQRSAAAMSATLGLALAVGLVWWEESHGTSIRDLGPIAIVIAVCLLCVAIFHAFRQAGGAWAGAGLAFGVGVLVAWMMGFDSVAVPEVIWTVVAVGLVVGIISLLVHLHGRASSLLPASFGRDGYVGAEMANVRTDLDDLRKDRLVAGSVWQRLRKLRLDTNPFAEHPDDARRILEQLRRMLPVEGWLTERLARLRARAHQARKGHVARIDELRHAMKILPTEARKRASRELAERYHELKLDVRLERLDKAVAENERRIKDITREAQRAVADYDYRRLSELLKSAEKLQEHNCKLFGTIDRTEEKLARIVRQLAEQASHWRRESAPEVQAGVAGPTPHQSPSSAAELPDARTNVAADREDRRVSQSLFRRLKAVGGRFIAGAYSHEFSGPRS